MPSVDKKNNVQDFINNEKNIEVIVSGISPIMFLLKGL